MQTILVLCGGRSTEHEIALRSAKSVINELDRSKYQVLVTYIDKEGRFIPIGPLERVEAPEDLIRTSKESRVSSIQSFCEFLKPYPDLLVFPMIHGQTGEDGEIQGFLQTLGLSYVGSQLTSSAICMDKGFANDVFKAHGLSKAPYLVYDRDSWEDAGRKTEALARKIEEEIHFPCFVKPCNNGSSIGVMRAEKDQLAQALENAFRYDRRIVIEEEIPGVEIEVSVLGKAHPRASQPGSYTSSHDLLDYQAKYNDKTTRENVPHPLDPAKRKEAQDLAIQAYRAASCEGFARVDLFLTPSGKLYINEINTIPGMTPSSLASKLWTQLTDMTFAQYLDTIIDYAKASDQERKQVERSWEQA